jgi:hypothetical protein
MDVAGESLNKQPNPPWWSSLAYRKAEPTRDLDFADMGTAFGLDASIELHGDASPDDGAAREPWSDRLNRRSVI